MQYLSISDMGGVKATCWDAINN